MITKKEFPILEFDTEKVAKINPENLFPEKFSADKMIISFFPEAINKLIEEKQIEVYCHIGGENPFDIYKMFKKIYKCCGCNIRNFKVIPINHDKFIVFCF